MTTPGRTSRDAAGVSSTAHQPMRIARRRAEPSPRIAVGDRSVGVRSTSLTTKNYTRSRVAGKVPHQQMSVRYSSASRLGEVTDGRLSLKLVSDVSSVVVAESVGLLSGTNASRRIRRHERQRSPTYDGARSRAPAPARSYRSTTTARSRSHCDALTIAPDVADVRHDGAGQQIRWQGLSSRKVRDGWKH